MQWALPLVVLLGLWPTAGWAGAGQEEKLRLALVSSTPSPASNNLIDLTMAKLSNQAALEFLERQAIARLLQEQQLSLSGLVDSGTAVAAGKLLRADLFALVETDTVRKEPLGLLIYDAATGIKLHDAALSGGEVAQQVDEVAAALRLAQEKRAAGFKGLRTVCVLSTRNADLPRSQDHLGHTVAWLLERHLLASPQLALVERKRLDWVSKEKNLAAKGNQQNLLAALVLVEVEIGRGAGGKGFRAAAFLTDHQGKQLGKVEVEETEARADRLAAGLQKALWRRLAAAPASQGTDHRRESQRFLQEGKRLFSHKEWLGASQALEAAWALNPSDVQLQANLAHFLSDQALHTIQPGRIILTMQQDLQVPTEKLKQALQAALRGLELRRLSLDQKKAQGNFPALFTHATLYQTPLQATPNGIFLGTLKNVLPTCYDDEARQLQEQFYAQHQDILRAELDLWAEVTTRESSPTKTSPAFYQYTLALTKAQTELQWARLDDATKAKVLLPIIFRWLETSRVPGATRASAGAIRPDHFINQYCQDYLPLNAGLVKVYQAMSQHPNLMLVLHGRLNLLRVQMQKGEIAAAQAHGAFQQIRQTALQAIKDYRPEVTTSPDPQGDLRYNLYLFLFQSLDKWPFPDPQKKYEERWALCHFMLDRHELVNQIIMEATRPPMGKETFTTQRWEVIDKALKVVEAEKCQLCDSPTYIKFWLQDNQKNILATRPEFAGKMAKVALPWKEARLLLDTTPLPGRMASTFLGPPVVVKEQVFVPVLSRDKGKIWLHLQRFSLRDQSTSLSEKILLRAEKPMQPPTSYEIRGCCLGPRHIFVGTLYSGVFAFSLDDNSGRKITPETELPSPELESLAYVDGQVYLGLFGGYLLALDPQSGKVTVLASSRRRERLSPFDDAEEFHVPYLVADPKRHRLLFLLHLKAAPGPNRSAPVIFTKGTTNGLWEYNLKTKTFKRHLELYFEGFTSGSAVKDGHILLTKPGNHRTGVMDFDLVKNEGKLLWAVYPIGPTLPKEAALSREAYYPLWRADLLRDGWIWCSSPLSRFSLSHKQHQLFDLAKENPGYANYLGSSLEPVGRANMLFRHPTGLWLLRME